MTDLYVYYRVRAGDAAALAPLVRAMQAALGAGQLKRRPDEKDGVQTWMEVYPAIPAGFAQRLDAAAAAAGLLDLLDGPRHTEIFTDLP
ncbi:MAG: DUF4936 family protein [Telluria sp.]